MRLKLLLCLLVWLLFFLLPKGIFAQEPSTTVIELQLAVDRTSRFRLTRLGPVYRGLGATRFASVTTKKIQEKSPDGD